MKIPACLSAFPRRAALVASVLLCALAPVRAEKPRPAAKAPAVAEPVYSPTDLVKLRPRAGRRVVIEGRIVAAGRSRSGATSYLNFTKNYRESVSLVFLAGDGRGQFTKEKLDAYVGQKVHIGGLLEERSGALQIRVFSLDQLKLIP